uniref:Glutaredoxin domain-containing protein n=1 Tax=Chenopodium quinoa TaxID=63459 RepID=A0A803MXV2_CHEQI
MGCVSSKLLKKNLKQELLFGSGDLPNHVVSLKSSTLGVLKLDQNQNLNKTHVVFPSSSNFQSIKKKENTNEGKSEQKKEEIGTKVGVFGSKRLQSQEELEVINTWELMEDLEGEGEDEGLASKPGFRGERSPFKRLVTSQSSSPKEGNNKLGGKENRGIDNTKKQQCYTTRSGGLKSWKFSSNSTNKIRKASSMDSPRRSNSGVSSSRRKSLSPLFDPELIDSLEKELSMEKEEQIKEMVCSKEVKSVSKSKYFSRNNHNSSSTLFEGYPEKCPPGGEDCVVIYTTTLRGIRKTFEDCNVVRSVVESYNIRVIERDVSMDSGFKEELRKLMGTKGVKVPIVFVKGRIIGGAEEVVRLDEEGKLEGLLEGIATASIGCQGCGGIRGKSPVFASSACQAEAKAALIDQANYEGIRATFSNVQEFRN